MKKYFYILFILFSFIASAQTTAAYEMRGVWIAVVKNIDWPSSNYISTDEQKKELLSILDKLQKSNINAVFFQVRTESDAVYLSDIEPYSRWLKKGDFDPLAFIIAEAHKRGMELHAWFNPYRSVFDVDDGPMPAKHISNMHPEWNVNYGKQKWLNPGLPEVRNYILSVIEDVVKRYDVDGVHFDDYFYPYPQKGSTFNDDAAYNRYAYYNQSRDDWRRENINQLIRTVFQKIKLIKPLVRFGVSPFGIWRNKRTDAAGSNTTGSESFDVLYADSREWLKEGWVDYIAPQIYWNLNNNTASYKELIKWWNDNSFGKDIYAGMSVYKIGSNDKKNPEWDNPSHFLNEIKLNRSYPNIKGSIFFNTSSFLKNPLGIRDSLGAGAFRNYAAASNTLENKNNLTVLQKKNDASFNVIRISDGVYKITLNVKTSGIINFAIFDRNGKEIKNLISEKKVNGFYEYEYKADNLSGNLWFRFSAGGFVNSYKIRI